MSLQFNRQLKVTITNESEKLVVEGLRVRFTLVKTLLGYPGKGKIQIYNLSEDKIQRITKRFSRVTVEGGYAGKSNVLFQADLVNFSKEREGTDSVFVLVVGTNSRTWNNSFVSTSFREGVTVSKILKEVAASFEDTIQGELQVDSSWGSILAPRTLSGSSREVLNKLARDYNFDWTINEGKLDIVPRRQVLSDRAIHVLTPTTGLIGSPTLTELGADFRILLNPEILPAREVLMQSDFAQLSQQGLEFRRVRTTADGAYKVMEVRMTGDSRGNDWYCDLITWRRENVRSKDED